MTFHPPVTGGLGLPLPSPDAASQRADVARIAAALVMIDAALAGAVSLDAVRNEIAAAIITLVGGAPAALDTVYELAAALGNNPNFASTVLQQIGERAPLAHSHTAASDVYPAVRAILAAGTNVAVNANDSAKTLTVVGQGGGIPSISSSYHVVTTAKAKATATVAAGQQDLVYGLTLVNTNSTAATVDLYVYDASAGTETLVVAALPVPAGDSLVLGSLEPMLALDAGDELRLVRAGGTVTAIIYRLTRPAGDYEMAVKTLTTAAVSQLSAITSGGRRVVSVLAGNATGTADHSLSLQAYDGATAWDLAKGQVVPRGQILQAVADGLGPRLPAGGQWRALASTAAALSLVTVTKVEV